MLTYKRKERLHKLHTHTHTHTHTQNPCWRGYQTREHIGLWRADNGWDGEWEIVSPEPLYGWGGGSVHHCSDADGCPSHEDPHLWFSPRGVHLLTHNQNNKLVHSTRGAYGWSLDGLTWWVSEWVCVCVSEWVSVWVRESWMVSGVCVLVYGRVSSWAMSESA